MYRRRLQFWPVLFLLHFSTHIICLASLGCNTLCIVISFIILWFIFFTLIPRPLRKWSRVSYKKYSPVVHHVDEISAILFIYINRFWLFFSSVIVTANLEKSLWFLKVSYLILTVLWSGWSSSLFFRHMENVPRAPTSIGNYRHLHVPQILQLFSKILVFCFLFSYYGPLEEQNPFHEKFFSYYSLTVSVASANIVPLMF